MEDFLVNISHELRTPVNVINGMSTLILKKEDRDDVVAIRDAGLRLSSQIEDIKYIKGKNSLIAHENIVAASTLNDYVVAIKDGFFIQLAYGSSRPLDVWAEDSFDENGDPIISYWEVNEQELSSQEEYDETINKYIDTKLVVHYKD